MSRHQSNTYALVRGPWSKIVVSSADWEVRVWHWETGIEIFPPIKMGIEHKASIKCATFTEDSTSIYTASMVGVLACWEPESGRLRTLAVTPSPRPKSHHWNRNDIYSIANCGNGTLIAAGCRDAMILLWDHEDSRWLDESFTGHSGPVYCIQSGGVSGNLLLSASEDTTIRLWDVLSKKLLNTYRGHTDAVMAVAFSPDTLELASGSSDASVRFWNREKSECSVMRGHKDGVLAVAFSASGHLLASSDKGGEIYIWNTTERRLFRQLNSYLGGPIHSVLFSDDITLLSGAQNGEVRIWDISVIEPEEGVQWMHNGPVNAIAMSSSGSFFTSGAEDSAVVIWSMGTGTPVFPPLTMHQSSINCIALSSDDAVIASGSSDRTVYFSDTTTGEVLGSQLDCGEEVSCLAFSHDDTRLVVGLKNNELIVWNISSRQKDVVLCGIPNGRLVSMACAFAPSSERIACFYYHKRSQGFAIWDGHTGDMLIHREFVFIHTVDTNPDGLEFIDGLRVWFSGDGDHVVLQFYYIGDGLVETQAFNISTGLGNRDIGDATRPLMHPQDSDIYYAGKPILQLPRDTKHEAVKCWDTVGDIIVVGLVSGRVYGLDFRERLHKR
ncbi:WD40-repeat-containing domain protein [Mycena crocata]|nr:WD40-repeat-containing domain protein [Mycena crocata]